MTPQQLNKHFFELERRKNFIDQFNFRQTNSWIHLKFSVYQASLKKNKVSKTKISNLDFIIKLFFSNLNIIFFQKKKTALFFGSSRGLTVFEENQSDIYFPYDKVKFSETNIFYNLNKVSDYQGNKRFYNINNIIIENIFSPFISKISTMNIWKFFLTKDFTIAAESMGVSVKQIRAFHIQFILNYYLYSLLLLFYPNQKEAFIVSAYSKSFICAALKNKNVPITEIQHGHIGKYHFGYNYGSVKTSLPLPDKILVENHFWKEELANSNFIQNVGFRKISKKLKPLSEEMKSLQPYILFTGQGMFQKEIIDFFNKSKSICAQEHVTIVYKPHPNEEEFSEIRSYCENNNNPFKFYQGADNLEAMISNCIQHISISSFCHFTAVDLLKRTVVLKLRNIENIFSDYCKTSPETFIEIENLEELYIPKNKIL